MIKHILLVLVYLIVGTITQSGVPQIGDDLIELRVDDPTGIIDQVEFEATLVPGNEPYSAANHKQITGRYVAARTRILAASIHQRVISAVLYVWDLENVFWQFPELSRMEAVFRTDG
jgi:hypothetical protein